MLKQRGVTKRHRKSPSNAGLDPALVSRFTEALARRNVPELAARALLRLIQKTAAMTRAGQLSDEQAAARIALAMLAAEDKAAELMRVEIRKIAKAVAGGSLSLVDARARIRGAA